MKLKELKTQKEVLKYLKNKYDEVRIYKTVKKVFLFKIFEVKKAGRTLYYYGLFDKKGNLQFSTEEDKTTIKIIAKSKINEVLKNSVAFLNRYKNELKAREQVKNKMGFKNPIKKPKLKKMNISKRFKDDKEFADWSWIWTIIRLGITHLGDEKEYFEFIEKNGIKKVLQKKNVEIPEEEKLLYKNYTRIVETIQAEGIYEETTRGKLLEARFVKLFEVGRIAIRRKAKGKDFYINDVFIFFYAIEVYKIKVNFKTIESKIVFKDLKGIEKTYEKFLELAESGKSEYFDKDILDNSRYFVNAMFNENYKDFDKIRKFIV